MIATGSGASPSRPPGDQEAEGMWPGATSQQAPRVTTESNAPRASHLGAKHEGALHSQKKSTGSR